MRDPARIDRITEKLNWIWHLYPDMRLWQLLLNITWYQGRGGIDMFYIEDDKAEDALDRTLKEGL